MKKGAIKRSVDAATRDGVSWAAMFGMVDNYTVPLALALGAGSVGIGLVRSLPPLLGSLLQLRTEHLVVFWKSRKKTVSRTVFFQAAALATAPLSFLLPPPAGFIWFLCITVIYAAMTSLSGPPWASLMGEYLPPGKRGAYFGWRNLLIGASATAATAFAGVWLSLFQKSQIALGFSGLFLCAAAFRIASWHYIQRMYESHRMSVSKPVPGSFVEFISAAGKINISTFTVCSAALYFSVSVAAPFFAVYMLKDLGFPYWQYMIVTTASPVCMYLTMRRWGKLADRFGSVKTMQFAVALIPLSPFLWCLGRSFVWLAIVEAASGLVWAAFTIGLTNFCYEAVAPDYRTKYTSYFWVATGLAQFAGALLGGWLYSRLPVLWGYTFISLLLLSAVLRIIVIIPFLTKIREEREGETISFAGLALRFAGLRNG